MRLLRALWTAFVVALWMPGMFDGDGSEKKAR